jgi:hypothetical protein
MMLIAALLMGQVGGALAGGAPVGIPKTLAESRAAVVSGVEYNLEYRLVPHAGTTAAAETMRFQLKRVDGPLLLDFRDGAVEALGVNGQALPGTIDKGTWCCRRVR